MTLVQDQQSQDIMREDEVRLHRLVEASEVEEARRLAPELAAKWPESREIQRLARVLEPPRIVPAPAGLRGRSFKPDYEWHRAHAHEYPGCWTATYGDRLIAADPSLDRVLDVVRSTLDPERELVHLHPPYLERA